MNKKKTKKELQSQLNAVKSEILAMKTEIANKQKEFTLKQKIAKGLEKAIEVYNDPDEIVVSEHALLRYFERVKGFDLNAVKAEILSENVLSLVNKLGGSGYYPNNGYRVVIKDNVVVTIV